LTSVERRWPTVSSPASEASLLDFLATARPPFQFANHKALLTKTLRNFGYNLAKIG
jgi:hypothetical protein